MREQSNAVSTTARLEVTASHPNAQQASLPTPKCGGKGLLQAEEVMAWQSWLQVVGWGVGEGSAYGTRVTFSSVCRCSHVIRQCPSIDDAACAVRADVAAPFTLVCRYRPGQ